jgi:predicted O-linked N-acetylglucosamine transferase (SPINDLY family)
MKPEELNQYMQRAVQLHQQGNLHEAEKIYRAALDVIPGHADILNLLGALCSQDRRAQEGIAYLEQALTLQPGHPHYLLNLGQAQVHAGLLAQAEQSFKKVLSAQPNFALAHFNLANVLKQTKHLRSAIQHYEQALALVPGDPNYYYNYGNALQLAGRYRSALEAYEKSLNIDPNNADAHNNLGVVLKEWERFDDALVHYKKAIELRPGFEDAHHNLMQLYESQDLRKQALQCIDVLQKLNPDCPHLKLKRACVFPLIPESRQQIIDVMHNLSETLDEVGNQMFDLETSVKYDLSPPSVMTYYGEHDRELRERFAALFERVIKPLPALPERERGTKPKIGFIVTRGHEGVFIKCMAGLIKQLPNSLDVSVLSVAPNGKNILAKDLPDATLIELDHDLVTAARQIHELALDVLYYWEVGTDSINYFLPFFKPARFQSGFWGWPVTSGIARMDYYVSCEHLETESAEQFYTEKLIKLPRLPTYYYRPPVLDEIISKNEFGFDDTQHLYLCTQNLRKVHPDMDEVFKQILHKDEKAAILFIHDKQKTVTKHLQKRLKQNMPEVLSRLHFIDRMSAEKYLALVKTVDVILDTFHYTGGANTNYDAFAAGTPVVTLPTNMHRGRYTCAAYQQMGYMDMVADSIDDYVCIAVAIASDKALQHNASEAVLKGCEALLEDQQAVDDFVASVHAMLKQQQAS